MLKLKMFAYSYETVTIFNKVVNNINIIKMGIILEYCPIFQFYPPPNIE